MKSIKIDKIVTHARPGSNLVDCIKTCIEIAAKEWRVIVLTHNSRDYTIDPEKFYEIILTTIEEQEDE